MLLAWLYALFLNVSQEYLQIGVTVLVLPPRCSLFSVIPHRAVMQDDNRHARILAELSHALKYHREFLHLAVRPDND